VTAGLADIPAAQVRAAAWSPAHVKHNARTNVCVTQLMTSFVTQSKENVIRFVRARVRKSRMKQKL
jgi:hypothetical protein